MFSCIQIDLDEGWTLLEYPKEEDIKNISVVYNEAVEKFLSILSQFRLKATFFIVGKDLCYEERIKKVNSILEQGHEIANHTFSHYRGFSSLLNKNQIESEIIKTQEIIESKLGIKVKGFKAPGYDIDTETLKILSNIDYLYDSSIFPSFFNPFLRLLHKLLAKKYQGKIFGTFFDGLKPLFPYHVFNNKLIEIPISTTPILRFPFHSSFSMILGKRYFNYFLEKFYNKIKFLNFTLHGIDLVSNSKLSKLFPYDAKFHTQKKESLIQYFLFKISEKFNIVTSSEVANIFLKDENSFNNTGK